jgi:hypothetical protein
MCEIYISILNCFNRLAYHCLHCLCLCYIMLLGEADKRVTTVFEDQELQSNSETDVRKTNIF